MKYRELLSLTDEEIRFILTDMFEPIRIENIVRHKEWNYITADMTTEWNDNDDGTIEITDEIEQEKMIFLLVFK